MSATLVRYESLPEDARLGEASLRSIGDEAEVVIRPQAGGDAIRLSGPASKFLLKALGRLMSGKRVALMEEDEELTPNQAAEILGLSRPLVVRRMDGGDLPFHYVGSHRRCLARDVLDLKKRLEEQDAAMRALVEDGERLEEEYGI